TGADAFLEPRIMSYDIQAVDALLRVGVQTAFGPPTAAAFPYKGGDVTVSAQRDIVGVGDATASATRTQFRGTSGTVSGNYTNASTYQLFATWLMSLAGITPTSSPADAARVNLLGAGVFAPNGTRNAAQTSWWIQYNSFQQGILSAGGNVDVSAG